MTLSDWAALAEIIGVAGIFVSLVYLNVQVRQSKRSEERQVEMEMIRSFQSVEFSEMMLASFDIPAGLSRTELENELGDKAPLLSTYMATWESLGIMVHRRQISLDVVCDFFSSPILQAWAISERYVIDLREHLGRETPWEWFEWLVDRVKEAEARNHPIPAYVEHRNWR